MGYSEAAAGAISAEIESMIESISHHVERLGGSSSPDEAKDAQSKLRFLLAASLIPSVMAATCSLFTPRDGTKAVDWAGVVNADIPEILKRLGSQPLPGDAEFLAEMSKRVDPEQADRLFSTFSEQEVGMFSKHSFAGTLSAILGED